MKSKLPLLFYLLGILYLLAAISCLLGVIQTLSSWNWLRVLNYQPSPVYNVFENVFFFLGFLAAAAAFWMRKQWAPLFCQAVALLAVIWFWVDRTLIARIHLPFKQQILPLATSILILLFLLLSFALMQPYMKNSIPAPEVLESSGGNDENTPA